MKNNKYLLKNDKNDDNTVKKSINKDVNLFHITFWDTLRVNCMYSVFKDYEYFDELLLWNTRNVDNMALMFCNAKSFNKPLNNWDVRNVREMYSMFSIAINFNQKLNNWNRENLESMTYMFNTAINFNQSLNNRNTSNVENMTAMFSNSKLEKEGNIHYWFINKN